ncbi:MAG: hypothetical protein M3524_05690, partial [Actinomycetota bacterium]|nr:hypothetical protein [Actinomycetota bacterium]
CWAGEGLERCGLSSEVAGGAAEAIQRARPVSWEDVRVGRNTERDLPWRARLRLAQFLLRMVRALVK